jgi:hypothetical protein
LVPSNIAGFQLRFVLIGSLILRGISRFSIFFFLLLRNRTGLFVKVIFTPLDEKPGLSHHCRNKMVLGCDPFFQFAGREHVGLTSRPICSDAPSSNPTTFLNPASPITIRLYGQSIQIAPINGFGSGLIEEVPGFCAERGMTPGVTVSASNFCFFRRGFSLDRRGWKAAPTGEMPTYLEEFEI